MKLHIYILLLLTMSILSPWAGQAQQRARVTGLEGNEEYMTLLAEEAALKKQEDSLTRTVAQIRERFRSESDPVARGQNSAEILKIEGEVFDVRNKIGQISVKITTIEQDFIINNLNNGNFGPMAASPQGATDSTMTDRAMLTQNQYFVQNLLESDLRSLRQAQQREGELFDLLKQYTNNNGQIVTLGREYELTADPVVADSLMAKFRALESINVAISDSIDNSWAYVFDNKSYVYSYLLDKFNHKELLENYAQKLQTKNQKVGENRGRYASDAVIEYVLGKRLITDYEIMVADKFMMHRAADSLRRLTKDLEQTNFELRKMELAEREFIKYDTVTVVTPTIYGPSNPVPQLEIPPRGKIYRILLGTYTIPQNPVIFKGAQPLSMQKEGSRYAYYAGGFRTLGEAAAAMEYLKKKWLKNPRIVAWENGQMRLINSDELSGDADMVFRVEITSQGELSDTALAAIREFAPGKEVSRLNNKYIVGTFVSRLLAQNVMDAMLDSYPDMEINVIAIEN